MKKTVVLAIWKIINNIFQATKHCEIKKKNIQRKDVWRTAVDYNPLRLTSENNVLLFTNERDCIHCGGKYRLSNSR